MGDGVVVNVVRRDRRTVELEDARALCASARSMGYLEGRVLEDGSVAMVGELMFTRAIYMGVTEQGWEFRFCFEDRELASKRFQELRTIEDEPEGYVARRFG